MIHNTSWTKNIIELLYKRGVRYACISPGSRNAPLTYQFIKHPSIKCISHIDERSSCYFGLGIAKITKKPVVILTTSGTATANLYPGIIESSMSMIPLIIVTADRPKYLLNTGENQTINQINIYGGHVRESLDIGTSRSSSVLQKMDRAIDKLIGINNIPGPIHFNIRFDEPLFDDDNNNIKYISKDKISSLKKSIIFKIPTFKRPLIICGDLCSSKINDIISLSKKIGAPIFADILSNMRYENLDNVNVYYDHYIDRIKIKPDLILRFGKKPISKRLNKFLSKHKKNTYLFEPYIGFNDDCPNIIKRSLGNISIKYNPKNKINTKWLDHINSYERSVKNIINTIPYHKNSEIFFINTLLDNIEKNAYLFIGNSVPIRNFDQFSGKQKYDMNFFSNRGSSGIDGVTSTALGISYINDKSKNYLFIGDVSFFHDSNAFHVLGISTINLTIIVSNNKGGQIFSKLDYAKKNLKGFKDFWITPPITKIKNIAKLYDFKYYKVSSKQFGKKIKMISSYKGVKIIEVETNVRCDLAINKKIQSQII